MRHFLRQSDDHFVATDGCCKCHPYASVSRGGLDEGVSWLDSAAGLSVKNHLLAYAVLDRATRVQKFTLGPYLAVILGRKFIEANERTPTDG